MTIGEWLTSRVYSLIIRLDIFYPKMQRRDALLGFSAGSNRLCGVAFEPRCPARSLTTETIAAAEKQNLC